MLMQARRVPSCSLGNGKALPEKRLKVWACRGKGNGAAESKSGPEIRRHAAAVSVGNKVGLAGKEVAAQELRQKTDGGAGDGETGRKAELKTPLEGGGKTLGLRLYGAEGWRRFGM